ncbi:MAG: glycosyltransferase, partial [Acidobacteriota bacterium]|nr:glycosyltransferase [Acidobacteriota bacterium]
MIIPVRGDPSPLACLLDSVASQPEVQLIVTASGDRDARWAALEARRSDVVWIWGGPGRGPQQNRGAGVATGRWLWFVHADSRVPPRFVDAFGRLDADPRATWGAFRFALASGDWQARLWERGVALRVRL